MSPDASELELLSAYRAQGEQYAEALRLATQLRAASQAGESGDLLAQALLQTLDKVAQLDQRVAETKGRHKQHGAKPGLELRRQLDDVSRLIEHLLQVLSEAEGAVSRRLQALAPQVDTAFRGKQMQRAYQQSMLSGCSAGEMIDGDL